MERWFSIRWCVSWLVSSRESNGESKGWVCPKVIDDPDGVVKIDSFKGGLIVPGCSRSGHFEPAPGRPGKGLYFNLLYVSEEIMIYTTNLRHLFANPLVQGCILSFFLRRCTTLSYANPNTKMQCQNDGFNLFWQFWRNFDHTPKNPRRETN